MSNPYLSHWFHDKLKEGEHGIYLTCNVDGKEVSEKMTVKLIYIGDTLPSSSNHQKDE